MMPWLQTWARIRPQSAAGALGSAQGRGLRGACRTAPDVEEAAAVPRPPGLLHPSGPGPPEEENLWKEVFSYGYPQVGHQIHEVNYMQRVHCVHKCLNRKEKGIVREGRRTESQFAKGY